MEPDDSLIMGNEELSTIPEKELDEFIKSSVEDLVPIPSESEDTSRSDSECDLPLCDDFSPINISEGKSVTFSNPLFDANEEFTSSDNESLSNEDVSEDKDIESEDSYVSKLDEPDLLVTPLSKLKEDECFDPGGDFVLEEIEACLTSDSIPPGIDDDDFDPEGDILLLEKLLNNDPSSPLTPKELNFEELKVIKSDVSTDFEDDYYDSEGDIIYLESLLIMDTIPNLPPEVFLDHEPISLNNKPNNLKSMVKVFDPGIHEKTFSPTYVRLPFENRHYLSLTYVIQIFLPYFTYPVDSSLPFSSGSEDIIFDPGISAYSFYSLEPVANESPMEISSSTYPFVEIPSGESKVHIEVLSVLWGNRLSIPDCSLSLSRSARVISSDEASLGDQEDASKQKRRIDDINKDAEITLVDETQGRYGDDLMFDTGVFDDEEVFTGQVMAKKEINVAEKEVNTADPVTTTSKVVTTAN
ncbi:hypothetical protein Tco_1018037 [Tanacetum coccineum]|uniref:Uncharacterized protein n=1 Tax=Tanacetum coccineum TaxID=301880 RepID=A0ABQ5FT57_9ASTR